MHITRWTLGTLIAAHTLAVASAAHAQVGANAASTAQGGGPTACSIIDAEELKRITGLEDVLKTGPVLTDPADLPKGRTECEYLGLTVSLSSGAGRESFERTRGIAAQGGTKVESVSGVGDEAFFWWDPKPGTMQQVGIAVRAGTRQLTVLDLASSDSIPVVKPRLLAVAKSLVPRLR
jgi:hypothetical protein